MPSKWRSTWIEQGELTMPLEMTSPRLAIDRKKDGPLSVTIQGSEDKTAYLQTRILIIEDEMMIAWMMESILTDAGFADIVTAADAEEASRAAAEHPPGLVVSDINLGAGIDGIEVSVEICRTSGIPVLFVTAYADDATRTRIAGHFPQAELLRKPINGPTLREAVRRALRSEPRH